jgi:hypothetical protein
VRGATGGAGADFLAAGVPGAVGAPSAAGAPSAGTAVMAAEAARNDRRFNRCMVCGTPFEKP